MYCVEIDCPSILADTRAVIHYFVTIRAEALIVYRVDTSTVNDRPWIAVWTSSCRLSLRCSSTRLTMRKRSASTCARVGANRLLAQSHLARRHSVVNRWANLTHTSSAASFPAAWYMASCALSALHSCQTMIALAATDV